MDDFYGPRRTVIADVCGLVGMAIAGALASSRVWPALANGFKTGRLEKAFFVFLAVVLTSAALGGVLGLFGGKALGASWERRHRRRRGLEGP